ncbi:MAG TPA: branched-chain amino acid ABC transporter permease [Ktedonobacterales bacterium]|nr:branched-chain amino acid ABC transporter permease [Ktedonobacterales bacterium]
MAKQTPNREAVAVADTTPARRENREWQWSLGIGIVILAVIAMIPLLGDQSALSLWTFILMYCVLAQSWNFIGGYAGRAAFGNVAFFGIGAYTVSLLLLQNRPYWLGMLLAPILAGLFALLLGLPVLRLKGHYFAIATLGIAEALGEIIQSKNVGAPAGEISLTPPDLDFRISNALFFYGFLALSLLILLITAWLTRTRFGYALVAIRENEQAAEALGIATYWYKVGAFVLSAVPTAIAGGLFAYWQLSFDPVGEGGAFDVTISVAMILMTFVGGAGTIVGPILGAIIIEYLDQYTSIAYPGFHGPLLGLLIILVTIFLPQGLVRLVQELLRNPTGIKQSYPTRVKQGVRRVTRFILSNGI